MITKEIQDLMNRQINAELWSAFLYLSMSVDARHKGMCGVAHWLFIQAREELDHSRILQNYMIAQGAKIRLNALSSVPNEWESATHFFSEALRHEQAITKMINEIVRHAQVANDYATLNTLSWFVDEQVEEEKNCTDLLMQFEQAENDPCLFYHLDHELRKRKYEMPHHTHAEHWIA